MTAAWSQLTFVPPPEAVAALLEHWRWRVPESLSPIIGSTAGDVFLEDEDGSIHWLETGTGTLSRIADSRDQFRKLVEMDGGAELLLAAVVEAMRDGGALLGAGRCLGFKRLPILGGTYTAENRYAIAASEWYGFSGDLHHQIDGLPDGTRVELKFE